jgi:hypothetical protein
VDHATLVRIAAGRIGASREVAKGVSAALAVWGKASTARAKQLNGLLARRSDD